MTHRDDPIDAYPFESRNCDIGWLVNQSDFAADLVRIRYVPEDRIAGLSPCQTKNALVRKHLSHVVEPVETWDLKNLSKSTRKGIVRDRKALAELGKVEACEIFDDCGRDTAITAMLGLKSDWLKQKSGIFAFSFSDPVFHQQLRGANQSYGLFEKRIFALKLNDQPIAYELCIQKDDRLMSVIAGYEPEYAKYGPGRQLTVEIIKMASALGVKSYDLLPPSSVFKNSMTRQVREYYDLIVPKTMRGRAALTLHSWVKKAWTG